MCIATAHAPDVRGLKEGGGVGAGTAGGSVRQEGSGVSRGPQRAGKEACMDDQEGQ